MSSKLWLLAPKELVKSFKTSLEGRGKLDKVHKIRALSTEDLAHVNGEDPKSPGNQNEATFIIPTNISVDIDADILLEKEIVLRELELEQYQSSISAVLGRPSTTTTASPRQTPLADVLQQTIQGFIDALPLELLISVGVTASHLVNTFPKSYTIYPPLLLLPPTTFQIAPWPDLLREVKQKDLDHLFRSLASSMGVTHIAVNAPIPLQFSKAKDAMSGNILRSPTNLTPLYGTFGPRPTELTLSSPDANDFSEVFWASATQNGIRQTWAPLYTMFSRGNVKEKARILGLKSLTRSLLEQEVEDTSAVDLYAGIGYFAFSYAKARVGKCFCWELNPWSIEGCRRGAEKNGWSVKVAGPKHDEVEGAMLGLEKFVLFQEDNLKALQRIEAARDKIPSVRHVNCGLLPTSQGSWETAIGALDPVRGGWIHVHENIAAKDIEKKTREILECFRRFVQKRKSQVETLGYTAEVECEHVERVKSYAPGVIHCVLDIHISPNLTMQI